MSIDTQIGVLEAKGKLSRYVPRTREPPKRRAYLTEQAMYDLNDPNSATNILGLRGYIESSLSRWSSGGLIYADRKKPSFLKRLDPPPDEIWEIRVTEPVVQARLFGRFASPDTIVFTNFHTRQLLRDKGSPEWIKAMEACKNKWESLFPNNAPFSGATIHEYVRENCDEFEI